MMMTQGSLAFQPSLSKGIMGKAYRILQSEQVFQVPLKGATQWFSVGSFSAHCPHQVAVKGVAGEVTCDCKR